MLFKGVGSIKASRYSSTNRLVFTEYILSIQGPTNIEASTCQNPMWSMRYMKLNRNKGMQAFAVTLSQSQNVSGSF